MDEKPNEVGVLFGGPFDGVQLCRPDPGTNLVIPTDAGRYAWYDRTEELGLAIYDDVQYVARKYKFNGLHNEDDFKDLEEIEK